MSMLVAQQVLLPRLPLLGRWAVTPLAWALLATAFLLIATLAGPGPSLSDWLGDPDDAVRLVTVRELLAGAPWFDTTLPRIGAPEPLLSHWSRLIDAPLAMLIGLLSPLLGRGGAELATRIVWPMLPFFALALIVAREAQRRAGWIAAAFVLFLVITSATALAQFRPGRIDHHNVQILCAVAGSLFLARSCDDRRAGWIAGALLGLGLAIGYEAIAFIVAALGVAAFAAVWQPQRGAGAARAATAATVVLFAALALTVPPARWLDVRCDALSLNLGVLAAYATAGLWAAMSGSARRSVRFAILGASVVAGSSVYAALEPACLAGPFGQVDAALAPIWLDHVIETKSILWLAASHPATALAAVAFMFAGAAAQIALWRQRPSAGTALAAVFVAVGAVLGCWQLKLLPYAGWLAAVPLAVWAAGLSGSASLSAPVMRVAAIVLLSQATLEAGIDALASPFRRSAEPVTTAVESADPRRPCFRSGNVRRLAALPPGLIAADIDLGPYIVALSPHRVVAAPYHRLEKGILANHAILGGTLDEALPQLRALGVNYVALCADRPTGERPAPGKDNSLRARLLGNERPQVLDEMELPQGAALRVWKMLPAP
jgi:hypothetical protein